VATSGQCDALCGVFGDANYGASASAPPLAFSVSKGTPVVTLSAPSAANANQEVSVNVSVAGIPGNVALAYPTGVVEFWDSLNGGPRSSSPRRT